MEVVNQSRVYFQYNYSPSFPTIIETIFSNTVKTIITEIFLEATKKVDKTSASFLDILTYMIFISNKTNFNINNVFFQDLVPKGTEFIFDSVEINNISNETLNPNKGFYIGTLESHSICSISFKVIVLCNNIHYDIKNFSSITYDYIYNTQEPPIRITQLTNKTCTIVENEFCHKFDVKHCFKFCNNHISVKNIIDISTEPSILSTKIIDCSICTVDKYKVIIIGNLLYKILYKCNSKSKNQYYQTFKKGFKTSFILPEEIKYLYKINFKISEDDIILSQLNADSIIVDVWLKIELCNFH